MAARRSGATWKQRYWAGTPQAGRCGKGSAAILHLLEGRSPGNLPNPGTTRSNSSAEPLASDPRSSSIKTKVTKNMQSKRFSIATGDADTVWPAASSCARANFLAMETLARGAEESATTAVRTNPLSFPIQPRQSPRNPDSNAINRQLWHLFRLTRISSSLSWLAGASTLMHLSTGASVQTRPTCPSHQRTSTRSSCLFHDISKANPKAKSSPPRENGNGQASDNITNTVRSPALLTATGGSRHRLDLNSTGQEIKGIKEALEQRRPNDPSGVKKEHHRARHAAPW
ncbi:hypothetical protein B0T16DRAFT_213347 [Cercophora newfieldiana]|uniref:Uncharacterized protein n=1 Tax=Cercophora newfieldiana TaxID=92897 RepID=A0AA40CK19_9PEZI|nr:hypothetical protein B0T16DRAFT_213347 [Cercophora newfieldiana]